MTESHAPVSIPENLCEHSSQIKTQTTYRVIDNKPVLTKGDLLLVTFSCLLCFCDYNCYLLFQSHLLLLIKKCICIQYISGLSREKILIYKDNFSVAPWLRMNSDSQHLHERCEQSLLEIQREEELQAMAESEKRRQQLDANRKENAGVAHSVWASASQKLTWNRPLKVSCSAAHSY